MLKVECPPKDPKPKRHRLIIEFYNDGTVTMRKENICDDMMRRAFFACLSDVLIKIRMANLPRELYDLEKKLGGESSDEE